MFQPDVPQRPLAELDASGQSNIKAFGTVHKRDVNGLLPLAARSILQPVAKKHTPAVARPAQKAPQIEAKAAAARGVGQWITVTLIIGELKGDEGRTARDRAMLLGDVAEPASYVKVVLGFERKGKAWIEKMLAAETDPAEGALAKRGADGKTKYIKLSAEEKQTAVQIYDSVWSRATAQDGHCSTCRRVFCVSPTSLRRPCRRGASRSRPRGTTTALMLSQPPAAKPRVAERLQWSHKRFETR